ncbi:M15 family metallopeptidase [Paenibacillus turicensis]|uniref:M15 family metallopeptidase n=1 Tax=Paenibacillus turicensis TaxID=160487 RepID=UPI003D2A72F9
MKLKHIKILKMVAMLCMITVLLAACAPDIPKNAANSSTSAQNSKPGTDNDKNNVTGGNDDVDKPEHQPENQGSKGSNEVTQGEPSNTKGNDDKAASADPNSMAVLINKEFGLPEDYSPTDLVYPDVPFLFKEKIEKRQMRSEAAGALEELFEAAKKDGIYLAGVSAYRSTKTQTALFNRYVKKDGLEKAKTYSAEPGHSEHTTGLAIDVSGSTGKCAAESCFGDTDEAKWLDKHATEYGFIIRYPEGKEKITGYKYEPWHLRYVGKEMAKDIGERGITLEEYYDAVPVSANP